MQKLFIESTKTTPEIYFSPAENIFHIKGTSSPEDVRAMYYPVIEWLNIFIDDIIEGEIKQYSKQNPLRLVTDLDYFNSSSAKFLFDIFTELRRLTDAGIPVEVEWQYDNDDIDQKEAGTDIANLAGMTFSFAEKGH